MAQAIDSVTKRSSDLAARYGGEEFVVTLPNTDTEGAFCIAEEIMKKIHKLKIQHENSSVDQYVTVSLGVSSVIPNKQISPKVLIDTADLALYNAKKQGRNRIVVSDRLPLGVP